MKHHELKQELGSVDFKLAQNHNRLDEACRLGDYDETKEIAQTMIDLCDHALDCLKVSNSIPLEITRGSGDVFKDLGLEQAPFPTLKGES